ncbi:MAG: protein kinase domain-containing protein, partial [Planctomycetota bacterium]
MSYRTVSRGDRISDYILVEKLGEGGFGSVWKARHHSLRQKHVAVKIPSNPDAMELLKKEAGFQHKLNHPNIVRTVSLDAMHDPPYFVMEYAEGRNLRALMREDGILPPPYAIDVAVQVLNALAYAHGQDIIHKDIKPENILVEKKQVKVRDKGHALLHVVKLTDFGFGKIPDQPRATEMLMSDCARTTGVRLLSGTLFYSAPEQMVPGRPLDARADVYSMGVVLYEMLTGELPLGMDAPSELNPVVTPELDRICKRALSIDRDKRYENAGEMLKDLQRAKEEFLLDLVGPPEKKKARGAARRTPVPVTAPSVPAFGGLRILPRARWRVALEWSLLGVITVLLCFSILAYLNLSGSDAVPRADRGALPDSFFLQGPLRVTTADEPALMELDGKHVGLTPVEIPRLTHARHEIRLRRQYFDDRLFVLKPVLLGSRKLFQVEDSYEEGGGTLRDADEGLALEDLLLRRQKGTLVVDVANVEGVPVYVDDVLSGKTPCTLQDLDAGPHRVRLEMTGFETIEQQVILSGNDTVTMDRVKMKAVGETSGTAQDTMLHVEFRSEPPGAQLFINEEAEGRTPITVDLPP